MILSDDMGFSDLGCYGGEIATPNLDALVAGGVRFPQFYNTARCRPTRASLLTGLCRDAISWKHEGNKAVRVADRKLMGKHGGPWELYDLSKDRTRPPTISTTTTSTRCA